MAQKPRPPAVLARIRWLISSRVRAAGVAFAATGLCPTPSLAEIPAPAPPAFVFGASDCPEPEAVERAVVRLVPPERRALLERGVRVDLEDAAESYRVTVEKEGAVVSKEYADPARDCLGRANFAAVFVVLTVMPPELGQEPVTTAPAPPPPAAPIPPPNPEPPPAASPPDPAAPLARLELAALFAAAPAILQAPALHAFGGELRGVLGRGALSGTLSVAVTTRAHFELSGVRGDVTLLPASAGLRLRSEVAGIALATDVGLLVVSERVRAVSLLVSQTHQSLDFGLRTGVVLAPAAHTAHTTLAPFVSLFAWVSPGPRALSAVPRGTLGNLPYLWLGGAVGVSLGL